VCVSWFKMTWSEPWSKEAISSPLWSGIGEYHSCECALTSPVISEFGMLVRRVKRVVMCWSSVCRFMVAFLCGRYRLVMTRFFALVKGTVMVWDSTPGSV